MRNSGQIYRSSGVYVLVELNRFIGNGLFLGLVKFLGSVIESHFDHIIPELIFKRLLLHLRHYLYFNATLLISNSLFDYFSSMLFDKFLVNIGDHFDHGLDVLEETLLGHHLRNKSQGSIIRYKRNSDNEGPVANRVFELNGVVFLAFNGLDSNSQLFDQICEIRGLVWII